MPDHRGKYTIEELLRAKRQEKPDKAFWISFNRELKNKQKLLIQKQLIRESRLKSATPVRIFKLTAFAACGAAAVAAYFTLQAPFGEQEVAANQKTTPSLLIEPAPSFTVATKTVQPTSSQIDAAQTGLREFATLGTTSKPRIIIEQPQNHVATTTPSPAQLSALETMAQLEQTIRAKRASDAPAPLSGYQFVAADTLFDTGDFQSLANANDETLELDQSFLLGRYADPLTGTLDPAEPSFSRISDIQTVNFSQIDQALSNRNRQEGRSIDALTVRF